MYINIEMPITADIGACDLCQLSSWRFRLNANSRGGMRAFMLRYSEERKAAVLNKLLPPQNRSVVLVALCVKVVVTCSASVRCTRIRTPACTSPVSYTHLTLPT